MLTLVGLLIGLLTGTGEAQTCKPGRTTKDKITKAQTDIWQQELYETPFLAAALMSTSEINITGVLIRVGTKNSIQLVLTKSESNEGRALLESIYRAAHGSEFLPGFKEGGEPLKFRADAVGNNRSADMFGKINTRVILEATLTTDQVRAMSMAVAGKQVDSVRLLLAGGEAIEKGVKDKNGRQMAEKITCFASLVDADAK